MSILLISGGARSGKSRNAESRTLSLSHSLAAGPIYIATATALDDEMRARIRTHQARRTDVWHTIEVPLALAQALDESDGGGPRLVDCLTLWLSNLLHAEHDWRQDVETLCETLKRQRAPVTLVTNEVGLGIVPDNALARRFRDAAGMLNQMVAEVADEVVFMVSGLPMKVK
ncbi:MAG: bifunctional adenosylcobinamide kinase/adenosylcobinamide-phosphate guanylyltransferase [Hyphomicrobiaceae bacterium]